MFDSPEWLALCRAVVAQPEDDLPRLVAADWLEESGHPERAEYIRVQIGLAKEPTPTLQWRERSLWNQPAVGGLWTTELCPLLMSVPFELWSGYVFRGWNDSPATDIQFCRGFPFSVRTFASLWTEYSHELVPKYPVQIVYLRDCERLKEADYWKLAESLSGVASLVLNCRVQMATRLRARFEQHGVRLKMPGESYSSLSQPLMSNSTSLSDTVVPTQPMRSEN